MLQSLLSYFQNSPSEVLVAWLSLGLVACNIISTIRNWFKSKKEISNLKNEISNLQQQITEVKNSNKNTVAHIQNEYFWFSNEQVVELYKKLRESDKELNEKFLLQKDFHKVNGIISEIFDSYNERFDILFHYIESVERQGNILFEHMKKQDEYITNIPIIEIPEDWVVKIEDNNK